MLNQSCTAPKQKLLPTHPSNNISFHLQPSISQAIFTTNAKPLSFSSITIQHTI